MAAAGDEQRQQPPTQANLLLRLPAADPRPLAVAGATVASSTVVDAWREVFVVF